MIRPWLHRQDWLKGYVEHRETTIKTEESIKDQESFESKKQIQYGIIYYPIECPRCYSRDIKTHTSRPPIRYHTCKRCGYKFKSREASRKENNPKKVVPMP